MQKVDPGTWRTDGLPEYVAMYVYVPDRLAARPPVLVASHHCQGTGPGTFNETKSTLVPLADANGFIMIFPEATGHNCWDVGSPKSLTHDGGGDTHAIAQMVRYALATYAGDAGRVYAFGGSSGGMMTQALLGVYPELFRAGVSVSGVPCGCWAVGYSGDTGPAPQWSGPCAGGDVIETGAEWGDLVRGTFPGYEGPRPRIQLWHGTADTLVDYANQGEAVKEWTNVLGLAEAPSSTDPSRPGFSHALWNDDCGQVLIERWDAIGVGHGVNWDTATVAGFLGLESPADPVTACGGAAPAGTVDAGSGPNGAAEAGAGGAMGAGGAATDVDATASGNTGGRTGSPDAGATVTGSGGGGAAASGSTGTAGGGAPLGAGSSADVAPDRDSADPACTCETVAPTRGGAAPALLVAFLGVAARRRRRTTSARPGSATKH